MIRISFKRYIFFSLIFLFVTLSLVFAVEQNAYQMAMEDLQKKGAVSCNPDEAYNFLISRASPGLKIKPTEQFKNGGFTNGIDPELACRLEKLLRDYSCIKIISGFRSRAKQAGIWKSHYDAWKAGKRKSIGANRPGNSCHEKGLAVDITGCVSKVRQILSDKSNKYKLHFPYSGPHLQCVEHKSPKCPGDKIIACNGDLAPIIMASKGTTDEYKQGYGMYNDIQANSNQTAQTPIYGNQISSPSQQYGYVPISGEGVKIADSSSGLGDNQTDSWWNDLLGTTGDNNEYSEYAYSDMGTPSVVETAGSSKSPISFKPVLGYTDKKPGANETSNAPVQNSSNNSADSSLGSNSNTRASRGGLRQASFASFFSPNEETAIDRFFLTNSISNYNSSGFSAFIDDTARANSTLDQSIYRHKFKDGYETGGNYAEQVGSINYNKQNTSNEDSGPSLWDTAKSYFSSGLDIASFVVFPTINIFAI